MTDHTSDNPRPQQPHGTDDRLLTIEEVANLTRVCVATLRWMRHTGTGPRSFRPARRVLYWHSDVLDWIEQHYNQDGPHGA
jgi:predicted DNA-binding transcriptional regulator AlpA